MKKQTLKQAFQQKAFTLIELIIVISLIAVLSSIAYISYSQYSKDAENAKKQADLDAVQSAIELEFLKTESFPSKVQ